MSDSAQSRREGDTFSRQARPSRNILLVDDSDFERFTIRAAVEGLTPFRVCAEAANGVEAIEKAAQLKPDLVVMDLAMPLMNGLEAATVIKNALPGIPIILLTLYAQELDAPRSPASGIATVLSKTDGLAPLLECLDRLLGPSDTE
jgi:CheY-like chemotaxis protein